MLTGIYDVLVHKNIDQTLVNSLNGSLNFEIGGLECRVITTSRIYLISLNKHAIPIL